MRGCLNALSTILILLGVLMIASLVWAVYDGSKESQEALPGLAVLAVLFTVPGVLTRVRFVALRRQDALQQDLLSYVRALDVFTVAEMAQKIGRSEGETEKLVLDVAAREKLDLAFDAHARRFFRRSAVRIASSVAERCPSCGAALGARPILAGEEVRCQYCNELIAAAE